MQHQVSGVKLDVAMLNVDMFSTRTDLCSLPSPREWKVSISAIEVGHPPPPRTVGLFLSSRLILMSLLRSEGGMGGLAVCTTPLKAGGEKIPDFLSASIFFLRAAAAAAAASAAALAASSVPRRAASSAVRIDPVPVSMAMQCCKINKISDVFLMCFIFRQFQFKAREKFLLLVGAGELFLVWGPIKAPSGSKDGVVERGG